MPWWTIQTVWVRNISCQSFCKLVLAPASLSVQASRKEIITVKSQWPIPFLVCPKCSLQPIVTYCQTQHCFLPIWMRHRTSVLYKSSELWTQIVPHRSSAFWRAEMRVVLGRKATFCKQGENSEGSALAPLFRACVPVTPEGNCPWFHRILSL